MGQVMLLGRVEGMRCHLATCVLCGIGKITTFLFLISVVVV